MASQATHTDDVLRVLVLSDPLAEMDKQDIQALLTGEIQSRYPRKQVVLNIWSFVLADTLAEIAEHAKFLATNDIAPYDWVVPLLSLQTEATLAPRLPGHPWPELCDQTAAAADSIASRTLLTTVPYFINNDRDFVAQLNGRIKELAKEDKRYLLDLSFLLNRAPTARANPASICNICKVVAQYIAEKQLAYDDSETKLVDTIFAYSDGDVNPLTVETDAPYTKNIERTRSYLHNGITQAQLADLRKKLGSRFVQQMDPLQNINVSQNIAQAKRTQTHGQNSLFRITRPDRVHAENYRGSSSREHRQSKAREETQDKENWPPSNRTTSHLSGGILPGDSEFVFSSSTLEFVSATGAPNLGQSNAIKAGYPNNNNKNKRTYRGAFHGMGSSTGDQEELDFPRPNMSHPVFKSSFKTGGKSHKEKKKRGKIVVLRYPPVRGALAVPSANKAQHRGGSIILGDEQDHDKDNSPRIPMAEKDLIGMEFSSPPRAQTSSKRLPRSGGNSSQRVVGDDGRVYIDPLQRQVSDAALEPQVANPFDLIGLGNVPNWDFIPGPPAADVIRSCGDDFMNQEPQRFARETGTVDPRDLGKMTSDDIIEAHIPVLQGFQEVYPDVFRPHPKIQNPLAPPALQLNGDNVGMRSDSLPNPLNLGASHQSQYQSPHQASPAGLGSNMAQAKPLSPAPTPRPLAPAPIPGFGLLLPPVLPSQTHLPSPVTAGFVSRMHDDIRSVRNSPEPNNNSANLPTPHNFSIPQSSPQYRAPEEVRQQWRKDVDKNVRWGFCSFCGLEKDNPKCGHVITNRQKPAETEITRPEVLVAEKQANVQVLLNRENAQASKQPRNQTQAQKNAVPVAQVHGTIAQQCQIVTATESPGAGRNLEIGTATPSPAVATPLLESLAGLACKAMSSMPKTTERGGFLQQAYDADMIDAKVLESQGQVQKRSNIQFGPEEDKDDTAGLSEVQLGKRPMPNEGWRRMTHRYNGPSHAKPQEKTSTTGSEQGNARFTVAVLESVEDHDKENGCGGLSNSDSGGQLQAHANLPTGFALSQEARKKGEKAHKTPGNTTDPAEGVKMAYELINSGEQQPSFMDVALMEAHRAFGLPRSPNVGGANALERKLLPAFPFAVPQTPQMLAVPQNLKLAGVETNPLQGSRPQTPMSGMAKNPMQLPEGQSPLPTFAPATPASDTNSQAAGSSSPWPQSTKAPPNPRVRNAKTSAESEDGHSVKTGRPKSEPKPRPSITKGSIAVWEKERQLKAASQAEAARRAQCEMQARYDLQGGGPRGAEDVEIGNAGSEGAAGFRAPQKYVGFGMLTNTAASVPAYGLNAATSSTSFGQGITGQRSDWTENLQSQQAYVLIDPALVNVEMRDTSAPAQQKAHDQVNLTTSAGEMKWKDTLSASQQQPQSQRLATTPTSSLNPGMRIADSIQVRWNSPEDMRRRIEALEFRVQTATPSPTPRELNDGKSCKYCAFRGEECHHGLLKVST